MAPSTQHPHTPLRRISQGSLRALSRSGSYPDAPHGLGFLEPAMVELADEAEALQANIQGLHTLSQSVGLFNEHFASYLYMMEMNALTTDWPQAPTDASLTLAQRRAARDAEAAAAALRAAHEAVSEQITDMTMDKTAATNLDETMYPDTTIGTMTSQTSKQPVGILKKKPAKKKLSPKERKQRNLDLEKTISRLPLEFRGSDPTLRLNMESVIESLMDGDKNGLRLQDMIKPEVNQARVNRCLIALVNKKIVSRDNSSGAIFYIWGGVPN